VDRSITIKLARIVIPLLALVVGSQSQTLPRQFFGVSVLHAITRTPWPDQPYGGIRLWDTDGTGWPQANPARGKYDWAALDKWLDLAEKNHVDVLYTFGRVPAWTNGGKGQNMPPSNLRDWETFVHAIVKHSRGRIKFWEIWNEPNDPRFWTGDLATLTSMAHRAYDIIKAAQPNALVLTPSATWTTTSPAQWFRQYFATGGGAYADVIAFHGYVGPVPEGIVSDIQNVRIAAKTFGLEHKPIWDTESSWGVDAKVPNDSDRANFLARSYILHVSQGVQRFYWYAWDGSDGAKAPPTKSWGTLWDSGNGPDPAARAYGTIFRWLSGAQLPVLCSAATSVWQCKLSDDAMIIWNPSIQTTFTVDSQFTSYSDLAGKSFSISNHTVPIGPAPILVHSEKGK